MTDKRKEELKNSINTMWTKVFTLLKTKLDKKAEIDGSNATGEWSIDISGKATSATYATTSTNAGTATYATKAGTATYATNSGTSSYTKSAPTYKGATTAASGTGGFVPAATTATKDNFLRGDGTWAVPSKATSATSATYAATATKAGTATYSSNGAKATSATSATYAATATKAGTATYATNSGTASYSSNGAKATSATYAATATKAEKDAAGNIITENYQTKNIEVVTSKEIILKDWENVKRIGVNLTKIVYGNGMFIIFPNEEQVVCYSTNGIDWEYYDFFESSECFIPDGGFNCLAYGNNTFIGFKETNNEEGVLISNNGINWNYLEISNNGTSKEIYGATYGNDKFIAVGSDGYVFKSSYDGGWFNQVVGTDDFRDVTFGNGMFVAVQADGKIYYSTDGDNWSYSDLGLYGTTINHIAYGNNIFVLVESDGFVYITDDLKTYTPVNFDYPISDIIYADGLFVAVGEYTIYYSEDCISWVDCNIDTYERLNTIAYGNGKFIAVGSDIHATEIETKNIFETKRLEDAVNVLNDSFLVLNDSFHKMNVMEKQHVSRLESLEKRLAALENK